MFYLSWRDGVVIQSAASRSIGCGFDSFELWSGQIKDTLVKILSRSMASPLGARYSGIRWKPVVVCWLDNLTVPSYLIRCPSSTTVPFMPSVDKYIPHAVIPFPVRDIIPANYHSPGRPSASATSHVTTAISFPHESDTEINNTKTRQ